MGNDKMIDQDALSLLLDEDIYLIDSVAVTEGVVIEKPTVPTVQIVEEPAAPKVEETVKVEMPQPITEVEKEPEKLKEVLPPVQEVVETKPTPTPTPAPVPTPIPTPVSVTPPKPTKQYQKVIIMVGYKESLPTPVADAITKIFTALQLPASDIQIINVLDPASKKPDEFTFSYLILMGGNGKNMSFLMDYTGVRNYYTLISHKGAKVFFAEAMDVYMKPENIELKKKYWLKLKEMFGV